MPAFQRPLVVAPIAAIGSRRGRQHADLLVVTQGGRGEPAAAGDVGDAKTGAHPCTINLQVDLKVNFLPLDAAADSDVVAAGIGERELVHPPGHVLDGRDW